MEISTEDKGEYFLNQNKSDPKLVNLKKKKKKIQSRHCILSAWPFCPSTQSRRIRIVVFRRDPTWYKQPEQLDGFFISTNRDEKDT